MTISATECATTAFIFEQTWRNTSVAHQAGVVDRLVEAGVGRIITETWFPDHVFIDRVHAAGIEMWASVTWFSDHTEPVRDRRPELWPRNSYGELRSQNEWYVGVVPSDHSWNRQLQVRTTQLARAYDIDGLCVDFFRWPVHWEAEFRPGCTPEDSSFDDISLAAYRAAGSDLPEGVSGSDAAGWIIANELAAWIDFKCDIINALARCVVADIRTACPSLPVGVFVVPGTDQMRRRYAGQDLEALSDEFDVVLPMLYHRMIGRDTDWLASAISETITTAANSSVAAVVQVSSTHPVAGDWDWGPPMTPGDANDAIRVARGATGAGGIVVFPGESLLDASSLEIDQSRAITRSHPHLGDTHGNC